MSRHGTEPLTYCESFRWGIVFLFLCTFPLTAQVDSSGVQDTGPGANTEAPDTHQTGGEYSTSLPASSFLMPTIIFRKRGNPVSGFLVDLQKDSLVLQSRGNLTTIPLTDAIRLTLPGRKVSGRVAVYGMLLGAYFMDLMIWGSESRPALYADMHPSQVDDFLTANIGYAAMGGMLGYLVGLIADTDEESFTFIDDDQFRRAEEERLRRYVQKDRNNARFNITIQMSTVSPREPNRADQILTEAGFPSGTRTIYNPYYWMPQGSYSLNIFRKGQVTWSFKPGFALGAAFMELTEPDYSDGAAVVVGDSTRSLTITSRLTAWYAVGTYEPMHKKWSGPFHWLIGAGVGFASSTGDAVADVRRHAYPYPEMKTSDQGISGNLFSAMVFTDLRAYLYPSLSVALNAEYVFVNPVSLGPIDGINTTETMLNFSSMSWGLVLGLHF